MMAPVRALCAVLALAVYWDLASAIHVVNSTYTGASRTPIPPVNTSLASTGSGGPYGNITLAATGSGSSYASQCMALSSSYSSAYTSWSNNYQTVATSTQYFGGITMSTSISYQDEQPRLCDGHARLLYSPAVPLMTTTINSTVPITSTSTELFTVFGMYPGPSPTCSYPPSDCDPFWQAYSTSLSSWQSANPSGAPQVTPPPQPPACYNSSYYSSVSADQAFISQCGPCTIFGQGVELVYFPVPTTVSRDMCATTPSAKLTNYGPNAVITAYAGISHSNSTVGNTTVRPGETIVTAVAGGHTFTSGTAYISISSVWAEDRCSNTLGTPVSDAILAMPSESVLSLRYSQNHFQYFWLTSTQTGFPVSYADFNQPVPYSAWNGQAMCDPLAFWECQVIYENEYRPQLAIPPQITMLNPAWQGCQLWYGGLYDPPLALTATTLVVPTAPAGYVAATATPSPSATATTPVKTYTAVADNAGSSTNAPDASNGFASGSSTGQAGTAAGSQQEGSGSSGGLGAFIYSGLSGGSASGTSSGGSSNSNSGSNAGTGVGTYNDHSGSKGGSVNAGGTLSSSGGSSNEGSPSEGNSGGGSPSDGSSSAGSSSAGSSSAGSSNAGNSNAGSSNAGSSIGGSLGNGGTSGSGEGYVSGAGSGSDETSAGSGSAAAGYSDIFVVNGETYTAVVTKNVVSICSTTLSSGAAAQTLPGGLVASYGPHVLNIQGSSTLHIPEQATQAGAVAASASAHLKTIVNSVGQTIVVTEYPSITGEANQAGAPAASASTPFKTTLNIAGQAIVVSEYSTPTDAIAVGSTNLVVGGPATTLANGEVISHASDGLVFTWSTAVALEQDGVSDDAASGSGNAVGAGATGSGRLSGQAAGGLSTHGAAGGANSLVSQSGATGTSRNNAASTSIQRITPSSKSAASSSAASFGLVIAALVVHLALV